MSSSRSRLVSSRIFTDASMTGTSTINSSNIDITGCDNAAIELSWTGTPNGTFVVQGAVRIDGSGLPVNYQTITLSASLTAAGVAGSHLVNLSGLGYTFIRVSYTNSSSTGTLNGWVTAKGA